MNKLMTQIIDNIQPYKLSRTTKAQKNEGHLMESVLAVFQSQLITESERAEVAEISVNIRDQFVTIRVFADATPDKFYEFFYEVSDKPTMIKPRNLGKEKPVHISDIPRIFNIEGSGKPIFHNRTEYERLLALDPALLILEKNMQVISSIGKQ